VFKKVALNLIFILRVERSCLDSFPSLVLHSRPLFMRWLQTPGRILFSPVEGLVGLILGVALQATALMVAPNPGRILFSPVEGLVGLLPILGVALQAPADDVDGCTNPR
jgi:hypothetical protein